MKIIFQTKLAGFTPILAQTTGSLSSGASSALGIVMLSRLPYCPHQRFILLFCARRGAEGRYQCEHPMEQQNVCH